MSLLLLMLFTPSDLPIASLAARFCPASTTDGASNHKGDMTMKKIFITTVSVLSFASAAYAAEVEGVVTNYDPATKMIVLESGEAFTIADGVQLDGLQPGGKVVITYDDGTTDATAVSVLE
jgi:hypothetical protein